MTMAAPNGVATRFWTLQKTIDTIHKAADRQKIFIICESPKDVLKVEGGVPIKDLNIGNMHMAEGKRQVAGVVAVDDDNDVEAFKKLKEKGVNLEIRKVPTESAEDIS